MLNIHEAAERLTQEGIAASDQDVLRWIQEGKIEADTIHRRKVTYKISDKELDEFILQKRVQDLQNQLENTLRENRQLAEQAELLQTRVNIEQSKVKTLKKLLSEQIETSQPGVMQLSELLGLGQASNSQLLKKEFKKLLKALHPDHGGDERLFKVFYEHYGNLK